MLRFIIFNDGMRQNWHMNAHSASAAEKQFLINNKFDNKDYFEVMKK